MCRRLALDAIWRYGCKVIEGTVGIAEAAQVLGLSEWAVRRRIKSGKLAAIRVERPQGYEWRVSLDQVAPEGNSPLGAQLANDRNLALSALVAQLAEERQRTAELEQERAELYGRLGFLQSESLHLRSQLDGAHAQLQLAQARILELEGPEGRSSETSNHPPAQQNGQDVGVRTASGMSEEQSEIGRRSEVSAPSAANGQDPNSCGPFQRFWRWLIQPL